MPRHARIVAAGAVHHLMVRGIAGNSIFFDDVDRDRFIDRVEGVFTEGRATCYAFALLSNHAHFLIRTGEAPMARLMRRILTGYAVSFNTRHKRSGHLFQNRYKSILCEEDPYFLQLVRYIHLNPLRVQQVTDLNALDSYPYSGHSSIMGHTRRWLDAEYVLRQFSDKEGAARTLYRAYAEEGIAEGRRNDLSGGGLIRSNKGWRPSKDSPRIRGDERILGTSGFVLDVLKTAGQTWERSHLLKLEGIDFDSVSEHVARLFHLTPGEILLPGKYRTRVAARSVLCYFLVRDLGMTATSLAERLGVGQPAVSVAVARGEVIVRDKGLSLPRMGGK
jgi:putative transposase